MPFMAAPRHFWDPFQSAMQSAIGDIMHVGKHKLPVVVYLDRVSSSHSSFSPFRYSFCSCNAPTRADSRAPRLRSPPSHPTP